MRHLTTVVSACTAMIAAALCAAPAQALDYPTREIHILCGFPAGGGFDIQVRYLADQLQKRVGKPVLVENKVGANGHIATEVLLNAKPDGYTMGLFGNSSVIGNLFTIKNLKYDPFRDLTAVTTTMETPWLLVVNPKVPATSVAELTTYLKAKTDGVTYGTQSLSSSVNAELYSEGAGLKASPIK